MVSDTTQIEAQDKFRADIYLAAVALNKQGKRAFVISEGGPEGSCVYRTEDGEACFVGHMIKDEHYNCNLEGKNVTRRIVKDVVEKSLGYTLDESMVTALSILQSCHDNWYKGSFIDKLRYESLFCGLDPYIPELVEKLKD